MAALRSVGLTTASLPRCARIASRPLAGLALALALCGTALGQEAVLERYALRAGAAEAQGVAIVLTDPQFGNGTAQSRVVFRGPDDAAAAKLILRVWRTVEPDEVVFALLVFRVEVRGYDAAGAVVYSRQLAGFTFGDSASGDWRRTLNDLPATTTRVTVVFYGNYE
jgi:hypothetical protein